MAKLQIKNGQATLTISKAYVDWLGWKKGDEISVSLVKDEYLIELYNRRRAISKAKALQEAGLKESIEREREYQEQLKELKDKKVTISTDNKPANTKAKTDNKEIKEEENERNLVAKNRKPSIVSDTSNETPYYLLEIGTEPENELSLYQKLTHQFNLLSGKSPSNNNEAKPKENNHNKPKQE